ncbi:hypothetical protein [Streptococcus sp. sy018]|uniref:hypothetical protein n=1 Tax=Streptococcus sp. sy018 TaxID=2600147 RepID=UPI0011B7191C|nr:hypothetical protein [Streptococcus sp. sy018]TWS94899.1 hypothetical protein FRX52_02970 [Streptococcus sp. sy018]
MSTAQKKWDNSKTQLYNNTFKSIYEMRKKNKKEHLKMISILTLIFSIIFIITYLSTFPISIIGILGIIIGVSIIMTLYVCLEYREDKTQYLDDETYLKPIKDLPKSDFNKLKNELNYNIKPLTQNFILSTILSLIITIIAEPKIQDMKDMISNWNLNFIDILVFLLLFYVISIIIKNFISIFLPRVATKRIAHHLLNIYDHSSK